MTPEMSVATQWQSHLPALLACVAVTSGDVLELGVGHFSTPQLHALCGALGRRLHSVEPDQLWRNEFEQKYSSPLHGFSSDWTRLLGERLSVAFVDHSPGGENRAKAFRAFLEISDYVVMHDAQTEAENFQAVKHMLEGLHWYLCVSVFPHTLVASKTRPIPDVLRGM